MLERTTKSYFEDFLSKDLYLERQELISLETKRTLRRTLRTSRLVPKSDDVCRSPDERIMTRKTRTRRPRIPAIQSGYCAVCSVPYNNVEDHIQSKKHLKLIGEDANYIALNGSLNGFLHTSSIPFLNLNGIEAIGVHETSLEEFSPKYRRKNMPRTRAASVVCDTVVKPSPLSPTGSDITGHHLRSRRNINYMTPPLDDDSLQEKPDISLPEKNEVEPVHHEYKEYRELRSSTRALAKLTEQISEPHEEVWNSGRPKRACIKHKRISADERLVHDNRTYYKVEVLSSKLRSSTHQTREQDTRRRRSQSPKREEENDKGLIVKFKKLRNSELVQLNNEATNFLFPKKDESSEDEDVDEDDPDTTASSVGKDENTLLSSDGDDSTKTSHQFKVEDDGSMDSTCSETKAKKRRRTHAEAFIMDNQKYYKFETPGSRLRYQGTYLSSIIKSPKHNGECTLKMEKIDKMEGAEKKVVKTVKNAKMVIDKYKFSFEKVPLNAAWYTTFQRLDKGQQSYPFFSDKYFWDPFILPYQMPSITPLDPKVCMHHYNQLLKCFCESSWESDSSGCSTPEPSTTSTPSLYEPYIDEDSKMSAITLSSTCSLDEALDRKRRGRRRRTLQPVGGGKNPRKSPRQHASTLAILSSLLHQRRRRSRKKPLEEPNQVLPTIPEEDGAGQSSPQVRQDESPQQQQEVQVKRKTPYGRFKPKIDYVSIAREIDNELDTALDDDLEDYYLEIAEDDGVDFHRNKMNVRDILRVYEEGKSKEDERSCRRFFNGTPGRKPGRRKKKNKTGWPNKNRRLVKKGQDKEKEDENDNDDSTIDSMSVNMDSEEEACDEDANSTDSIKKLNLRSSENKSDQALSELVKEENCDVDRVEKIDKLEKILDINDKVLTNKVTNRADFQPYVCVQKLDSDKLLGKHCATPKRTNRRQRRMPGSPKSPRMLRRPRGRWYRER